ncbi:MAG: cytochrome c maturation protein CcmE [Chlamydiae bacterium]|nr:cytochrome c maturation protein CcmE [Chlamydiota bacterium]MBI3276335.1 cytochrome c maturation protein CcmE [Chlamydiota bacterium]
MNPKKIKFTLGILIILGALAWLAFSGFEESKAYYVTIDELKQMGTEAYQKRVRVAGIVVENSIERKDTDLLFQISQGDLVIPVRYLGRDPIPDSFKGGTQAVAEGKLTPEGIFQAQKIQAKCASKYEGTFQIQKSNIKNQNDIGKSKN